MAELQLEQAKHNLEEAQVYINKMRNNLELLEVDKFKDLKKVFSEGAIIECRQNNEDVPWDKCRTSPKWRNDMQYRIKDNISISSWQAHKDVIKQFWDGAEIEVQYKDNTWHKDYHPKWEWQQDFRIKQDTWKLPEYEEGSEWVANGEAIVWKTSTGDYTKAGRRRATKELAERCAKASKQRDLLEAWRDHLDPEYLNHKGMPFLKTQYYIWVYNNKYYIDYNFNEKSLGTVYMDETTASKICIALNNKEIKL